MEAHRRTAGGGGVDPGADRPVPGYTSDHWLYAAFHLIALRGLRRGEAAGLRWCDIDLDHKVAHISWQIQYTDRTLVLCPLKTATSRRDLALDATRVRVLRRYRQEQDLWYRAHGRIPSGFVFTALDGGPLSPDYLTATFTQLVRASGLPPVRLHDLRHGAASLALAAGVDLKVVADQLGHCSIVLTADTYVNSRELHQPGEKPQVSRSSDRRNSVPLALTPAA
jgi:integrase